MSKITIQSVAAAVILLAAPSYAQEKQPAAPEKASEVARKTAGPRDKVDVPEAKTEQGEIGRRPSAGFRRDPFRPFTLSVRPNVRRRENLSPLERFELGQLRLVGIVWDTKTPTALIEDASGLGYTVKVGTLVGANDGKVKAIHRNQIVIEEFYSDFDGARKRRDTVIKLLSE